MRMGSRKEEREIIFRFATRNRKSAAGMRKGSRKRKGRSSSDLLHVTQNLQKE
jgi:hypothetical protein